MKAGRGVVLVLVLALALAATPLHAADSVFEHPATPAALAQQLGAATRSLQGAQTLRGGYVQRKTLQGVPKPLEAEGTFLFARGIGIAWRTIRPFESELVITPTDIIQRENGRVTLHLAAARQPSVRVVSDIFAAVFALDFEQLAARFELFSRGVKGGWELGLRPRAGAGGALKQIVVGGQSQVQRVRVSDSNGDETDIRLRDATVSAAAPSADELQRFRP